MSVVSRLFFTHGRRFVLSVAVPPALDAPPATSPTHQPDGSPAASPGPNHPRVGALKKKSNLRPGSGSGTPLSSRSSTSDLLAAGVADEGQPQHGATASYTATATSPAGGGGGSPTRREARHSASGVIAGASLLGLQPWSPGGGAGSADGMTHHGSTLAAVVSGGGLSPQRKRSSFIGGSITLARDVVRSISMRGGGRGIFGRGAGGSAAASPSASASPMLGGAGAGAGFASGLRQALASALGVRAISFKRNRSGRDVEDGFAEGEEGGAHLMVGGWAGPGEGADLRLACEPLQFEGGSTCGLRVGPCTGRRHWH